MGDQKHRSPLVEIDLAVVDDFCGWRRRVKVPGTAAGEVRHRYGRRGEDQPMSGDGSLAADIKTGLVLQHHVAVGIEIAEYLRRVRIVDSVPHERGTGRLDKIGGLAEANVETLPVDERAVGSPNGELRSLAGEGGSPLAHRGPNRVRGSRKWADTCAGQQSCCGQARLDGNSSRTASHNIDHPAIL